MPSMTDPTDALLSFQEELLGGSIALLQGVHHPDLYVHLDHPAGSPRFTYVTLDGKTVTALVILVKVPPIEGVPCFQIGYAVPPDHRNEGRAKKAVLAAMDELCTGMFRNGVRAICIEAVISTDNEESKRVALATLSSEPTGVTDDRTGSSALHYVRKFSAAPSH